MLVPFTVRLISEQDAPSDKTGFLPFAKLKLWKLVFSFHCRVIRQQINEKTETCRLMFIPQLLLLKLATKTHQAIILKKKCL